MEELLNKLIKKGRVPFGIYGNGDLEGERIYIEEQDEYTNEYRLKVYWINVDYVEFNGLCDEDKHFSDRFSLREIVSKGSGLWQFVCENGMINVPHPNKGKYPRDKLEREQYKYWDRTIGYYGEDNLDRMGYSWDKYQFRLIEASLKDESVLESFILDNIKVDVESK